MATTTTIPVQVRTQGGAVREGTAFGRAGSQIYVRYRIASGEPRERMFTGDRVEFPEGRSIDELPRYRRKRCPGFDLPEPVEETRHTWVMCARCDRSHRLDPESITGSRTIEDPPFNRQVHTFTRTAPLSIGWVPAD